ncbi:MAG: hypothetical protein NZ578_07075, partial [Candidatus Binatia bacterium]|nr:hypothetical protein [Candidatus Binatia bacterium]
MAKLRAITGGKSKEQRFSLVYAASLYPPSQVSRVSHGEALLRDGTTSLVPLQVFRGSRAQIRAQVLASLDALFEHARRPAKKMAIPAPW